MDAHTQIDSFETRTHKFLSASNILWREIYRSIYWSIIEKEKNVSFFRQNKKYFMIKPDNENLSA